MADGVEFSIIIQYLEGANQMTTNARDEKWSEWIEWSGGHCPVDEGCEVSVNYRDGDVNNGVKAGVAGDSSGDHHFRCAESWDHNGSPSDIIAYRYKIKEPESDMHPDLEWLARNVSEWGAGAGTYDRILKYHGGVDYCQSAGCDKDGRFNKFQSFTQAQWQAARQQLGLDQPAVTPEEEEAWQAKERKLIGGPRKAESFLMQAADLMAERGEQYDQDGGERSMGKTVSAFNTITGRDLTESEGWLLMSILKRVRQHSGAGYHKDSAEDAVAYAALEAEALECAATQQS